MRREAGTGGGGVARARRYEMGDALVRWTHACFDMLFLYGNYVLKANTCRSIRAETSFF